MFKYSASHLENLNTNDIKTSFQGKCVNKHSFIDELVEGIKLLRQNRLEEASSTFLNIYEKSQKEITITTTYETEFSTLEKVALMAEAIALYYFCASFKKQQTGDSLSQFGYLCYTAGIHTVLRNLLSIIEKNRKKFKSTYNDYLRMLFEKIDTEVYQILKEKFDSISGAEKTNAFNALTETIDKILKLTNPTDPKIRELAVKLARRYPAGDFKQARRIFEFVRDEIFYIYDPLGVEEIQTCEETLKLKSGDCEDKIILLVSLLEAIGFETCLFIADTNNDGFPDHIFAGVYLPDAPEYCKPFPNQLLSNGKNYHDLVPMDPTYEDSDFGVIPIIDLEIQKIVDVSTGKVINPT